jgi:DNA-binding XRE family transcriptional regulator
MVNVNGTAALRDHLAARRELPPPTERRAIREKAGVTRTQVAKAVGVSRQCIAFWEAGLRTPRDAYLEAYMEVLQLLRRFIAEERPGDAT